MNAAVPYTIPQEERRWPSLLLAAVVHLALVAFLWVGIRWQSETPVAVEAEVWDMKVQEAAPVAPPQPVVEPEPEPPKPVVRDEPEPEPVAKPDIALEQAKRKEAERKEAERIEKKQLAELEKQRKLDEKKKAEAKKLAEQKELDKIRQENMKRILAGTGSPNSTGVAPKSTGPRGDPSYAAEVVRKIKSNITYGGDTSVPGDPTAEYRITQLPSGEIISVKRIRSSGIPAYDAAVEKAIAKSSPLPRKKDGTVDREIVATFILKETP
jgi:colicin import membrane protein